MNILITGATGFVGSALLNFIKDNNLFSNDRIILLTSKKISGYECDLHKNYTFNKSDFIDKGINQIDIVFHLGAATPKTRAEYDFEFAYKFAMNVKNTIHLYENLPNVPKKFIFISSTDVYSRSNIISEKTPYDTSNMYSCSKLMCESYLQNVSKRDNFILQILRLGQIYGEGEETYSKIVSFFVKQVMEDKLINIFGTGYETRSMLYVKDCVRCIVKAGEFKESIEPCNIASSQSITVKELVSLIYKILNKNTYIS